MSLPKEILESLDLKDGESVLEHWSYRHHTAVLTDRRVALLSPHHVLGHPHHEVTWSEELEVIKDIGARQLGSVEAPLTTSNVSGGTVAGRFGGRVDPAATGPVTTEHLAGDFIVTLDNVQVYSGRPDEANRIRDRIEDATAARKQALQSH